MFSIKAAISYGWQKFKANLSLCLVSTLIIFLIGIVGELDWVSDNLILSLILFIASIIARIGYTKIFLRIYDGESPKASEMSDEYKLFWKYLGVSILSGLAVVGGLILLILPGIFWAVRFSFATIILVDTKTGPITAMKESYAMTKGKFWKLFLFWLAIAGINILGFIAFGVGALVSVPVSLLAIVYVYRELSKNLVPLVEGLTPTTASI